MSGEKTNTDTTKRTLTWLITGASQGFGRALAAEVLSRGNAGVVGPARADFPDAPPPVRAG